MDQWLLVLVAALFASTVAAIAGTGGGIILLPVLVAVFGVREAVPLYTVAQVVGNLSRVGLNRRLIDVQVVRWFVLGAIPFCVLGAWLFTRFPEHHLLRILGAFLVAAAIWRRLRRGLRDGFDARWFVPIGASFAVVSGLVGSAGPFLAPFYLSYGLAKGAFIGTEALGTAAMHFAKLASYQSLEAMNWSTWLHGLLLGPVMVVGSYLGKRVLDRLSTRVFLLIVDLAVGGFGLWFLLA